MFTSGHGGVPFGTRRALHSSRPPAPRCGTVQLSVPSAPAIVGGRERRERLTAVLAPAAASLDTPRLGYDHWRALTSGDAKEKEERAQEKTGLNERGGWDQERRPGLSTPHKC